MAQSSLQTVLVAFSLDLSEQVLEVGAYLERFGYRVSIVGSANEILAACGHEQIDAVICDLPLIAGLGVTTFLEKLMLISPVTAPVVVGDYDELSALRLVVAKADGEYALLPLSLVELKNRIKRLVAVRTAPTTAVDPAAPRAGLDQLIGRSEVMESIRDRVRKVAALTSTVLVTGESGVGKELIARAIHRLSPRHSKPFIALNCSALPESLLESELFGHERGAFTGASGMTKGKFELADRGTLFLDEIGDMNSYTQAKILRVLEEREFMRVGGSRNIRLDVRLVAATNADLVQLMRDGRFREDLFYRLKVLTVEVPPLRDRADDIPELARHLIDRFARANAIPPKRLTDEALDELKRYRWPGNVRELRNTIENLVAMSPGSVIGVEDLPFALPVPDPAVPVATAGAGQMPVGSVEDMERILIRRALAEVGGNRTRAARILKIGVRTLQRKIKRYGLDDRPDGQGS